DEYVRLIELTDLSIIHLRLLGFERSIGIEVWDTATELAQLPALDPEQDLHGLALVDARAKHWGSALTPHGRVTWAELDVYDRTSAGLPIRARRTSPYPRPFVGAEDPAPLDAALLNRVRNGLETL